VLINRTFIRLCLLTLFIKINFLFNQMILKIDTRIKLIKLKKNIMQGNTYQKYYMKINIFIFKNKVLVYKNIKKNIDES
jgi:hypothetical protein